MSDNVYRIIGVMPKGFQIANFGVETDIWRQISMQDPNLMNRQIRWLLALGRLKAGVGAAQAQADLRTIAQRLSREYPETNKNWGVLAMALPLRTAVAGLDGKQPLLNVQTMDEALGRSLGPARFFARILGVFGLMAVVLAAIGIYGVVSSLPGRRSEPIRLPPYGVNDRDSFLARKSALAS
jgi:hypothetical protein